MPMDAAALFQGTPGIQRRRNDETALKVIREQLHRREKVQHEGSSSGSCRPSTPHVLLHRTEGRTRWSRTAERRLWWRGLCTMKPALEPDLESHLLQAALGSVFTLGTEMDAIDIQALHKVMQELLDAVLGNLLAESPDADRLHYILEISAEFPSMGHHVAQLALFVSDPDKDISWQAREGTYQLYQLLLEQRGLTIHETEDLWCHDWHRDSRLLGYKNTAMVGEGTPGIQRRRNDETALNVIREHLQHREKDEGQQLRFPQAIYPACLAAQDRGQDTLEPHCCKAAVVERIVELIEELPKDSPPSAILANSLVAVGNLSTMKPALEPDLESHLLQAALGSVFTLDTEMDAIDIQALHKVMPELLDAVLGNLLAESPDRDRLHYILEHVNLWIVSRVSQERARAIRSSTALLRYAVTLPEFDISAEFPRMGHHVAQLALFVSDPDKDISWHDREGTYWLYQLLLDQRGLTIHEAGDLWCHDWHWAVKTQPG
ncbi:uncharacterized protein LOC120380340 [Mauremys reevesii]|uniref:uncharacterized protein LOC120380340 n=1 Tax=Mauremys reevesii TaxID=260615 RepID=UPI00193FBD93|nr:uncharacterized protein LOC120380340 [Mauremys reevesii]